MASDVFEGVFSRGALGPSAIGSCSVDSAECAD